MKMNNIFMANIAKKHGSNSNFKKFIFINDFGNLGFLCEILPDIVEQYDINNNIKMVPRSHNTEVNEFIYECPNDNLIFDHYKFNIVGQGDWFSGSGGIEMLTYLDQYIGKFDCKNIICFSENEMDLFKDVFKSCKSLKNFKKIKSFICFENLFDFNASEVKKLILCDDRLSKYISNYKSNNFKCAQDRIKNKLIINRYSEVLSDDFSRENLLFYRAFILKEFWKKIQNGLKSFSSNERKKSSFIFNDFMNLSANIERPNKSGIMTVGGKTIYD